MLQIDNDLDIIARWDITRRCNLRCAHCYNWGDTNFELKKEELNFEQVCKVAQNLRQGGVKKIALLGGEPLVRDDCLNIISFLSSCGFHVTLNTNGTLIDRNLAEKLINYGCSRITISIDGLQASHDLLRGEGNYSRTICGLESVIAIRGIEDANIEIGISTVISPLNYKELPKFICNMGDLGVDYVIIAQMAKEGRAEDNWKEMELPLSKYLDTGRELIDYFDGTKLPVVYPSFLSNRAIAYLSHCSGRRLPYKQYYCYGAVTECYVQDDGRMFPCQYLGYIDRNHKIDWPWKFSDNNLLYQDFSKIWKSEAFEKERSLRSKKVHRTHYVSCSKCKFSRSYCSPCAKYFISENSDPFPLCSSIGQIDSKNP